jgi:hypothetical protein
LAILAVVGAEPGCGTASGPLVVPVSGTVTRTGKPVPNLFLNFMPVLGRPSWAITDANGRYALEYDDTRKGATVGSHTVWVSSAPSGSEGMGPEDQPQASPELPEILKKYGTREATPLKVEIKSDTRVLDLQLD